MLILDWPVGTLLVAGAVAGAFVVWLVRRPRYPGPRLLGADPGIDQEALEEAEREVRELEAGRGSEDGLEGDVRL